LETERLTEQGFSEAEARMTARRTFGNVTRARERFCESGRLLGWDHLVHDLRFGLRQLRKHPGFLSVAVLTLALGVGANTGIFSVVNAVLLSPLPYADPDRLVLVKEVLPKASSRPVAVSAPDIAVIRELNRVFGGVAGFRLWTYELSGTAEPERVVANRVGSNLFAVLGVQPIMGRAFAPEEEPPGHPVVVLSYALWQRRFGGDRNILGQTIDLDRMPHRIIGVMPKSFFFPLSGMSQGEPAALWVPLALTEAERSNVGENFDYGVVARIKTGTSFRQASADLELVARGILETYARWARAVHQTPGRLQLGLVAEPLVDQVRGSIRSTLWMLLGAVGCVLLIACVNVANLLLIRAAGRQKEMAIRLAMGASRFRLFRQLLVEGILLASLGGGLGLTAAFWIKETLVAGMPSDIPQFRAIELDLPVLLFTFFLTAATGIAFGALPALSASRADLNHALKESGHSGSQGPEHRRMRAAFVAVEIALSVVLLAGAGLLLRSFLRVLDTNPGFRPEHVLTASIDLPPTGYRQESQALAFYRQLMERLRQMPGAAAVGGSTDLPLLGGWTHIFTPEGYNPPPGAGLNVCNHSLIYGDYLQAMGIPLLRGRHFTERDRPDTTSVLIVSEALAKKYWPGQDPIGKRLKWGAPEAPDRWLTVVGVAGDVKQGPLDAATVPHSYESYVQLGRLISLRIAVRAVGDPSGLATDLRTAVWSLDRRLALGRVRTMEQVISRSTATRRFSLYLLGSFAALALVLASLGIYGLLAYSVARRTHEIGMRMALGARGADVVRLVLVQGLPVVSSGIVLGTAGALGLTGFLQKLSYEVKPTDPATFAGVLLLLCVVALAACCMPAWRATRIQPATALRHE
jgi:putative ABC transport system permease protein